MSTQETLAELSRGDDASLLMKQAREGAELLAFNCFHVMDAVQKSERAGVGCIVRDLPDFKDLARCWEWAGALISSLWDKFEIVQTPCNFGDTSRSPMHHAVCLFAGCIISEAQHDPDGLAKRLRSLSLPNVNETYQRLGQEFLAWQQRQERLAKDARIEADLAELRAATSREARATTSRRFEQPKVVRGDDGILRSPPMTEEERFRLSMSDELMIPRLMLMASLTDADIESGTQWPFSHHREQIQKSDYHKSCELALRYWDYYPAFAAIVQHSGESPSDLIQLNKTHCDAVRTLLLHAERHGIECSSLAIAGDICRELHSQNWQLCIQPGSSGVTWPASLGSLRDSLTNFEIDAIRSGEVVVQKLKTVLETNSESGWEKLSNAEINSRFHCSNTERNRRIKTGEIIVHPEDIGTKKQKKRVRINPK